MAMRMLAAGGVPVVTDGVRRADEGNPHGYYELEQVKTLAEGAAAGWLADARGKAVKIVSLLLTHLPESYDYQVIFLRRDLREVLASQNALLDARGEPRGGDDERMRVWYEDHLRQVERFLARRACFTTLDVDYHAVLRDPRAESLRMAAFVGQELDVAAMARAADPALYRRRFDAARP